VTDHSRRSFLTTLGAAAAALATGSRSAGAMLDAAVTARSRAARRLDHIGIQLYTVRQAAAKNLADTLARVARIGYDEVEFAGYFDHTPKQVRDLLALNGLRAPSTHLDYSVIGKNWPQAIADSLNIGHQWITIAWVDESQRRTLDGWKRVADTFNTAAAEARKAGLGFAYHNHDFEMPLMNGVRPLDFLIENTDPSVVDFEMDIYWLVKGGGKPLDYFARYPHRFAMVHVKDAGPPPRYEMRDVGAGTIDFGSIFAHSAEGGIQHYFVEHDQPADPFASAAASYRYLKQLEF
jgi:sugar phosphate isomerase/epimerase